MEITQQVTKETIGVGVHCVGTVCAVRGTACALHGHCFCFVHCVGSACALRGQCVGTACTFAAGIHVVHP